MNRLLNTFGNRLKYYRVSANMTQQILEAITDIDRSLISRYERGLSTPGEDHKKRLAKALKVPISAFTSTPIANNSTDLKDVDKSTLFNKKEFALRLRTLRDELGLSQVEFSFKTKIYHGQIAKYERELSIPSLDNCILLADSLGVTVDYLLRGENTNSSKMDILDSKLNDIVLQVSHCSTQEKETIFMVINGLVNGFQKLNKTSYYLDY